jgi:hypothetical protein
MSRDTGGYVYREREPPLIHRSWEWDDAERGKLAGAQCMLELAVDDLRAVLKDFESTGTRPGWVAATQRLIEGAVEIHGDVTAELDT